MKVKYTQTWKKSLEKFLNSPLKFASLVVIAENDVGEDDVAGEFGARAGVQQEHIFNINLPPGVYIFNFATTIWVFGWLGKKYDDLLSKKANIIGKGAEKRDIFWKYIPLPASQDMYLLLPLPLGQVGPSESGKQRI